MDLQGKKVLVFGAGISGIGSCGLLEKEGAEVILYDGNDKKDAEAMKAQLGEGSKVRVVDIENFNRVLSVIIPFEETEVQSCTDYCRYHSCKNTVDKL